METKKNSKANLDRFSLIFFQVGLILVLAITYGMMEWQTYENEDLDHLQVEVPDQVQEDIPITQLNVPPPPPPPPPPPSPEIVEIIEDDLDIEEDIIESTESSQEEKIQEIAEVSDIEFEEEEEEEKIEEVPFVLVENIPIYPGCENIKEKEAQMKCMTEKIDALVKREFNTQIGEELGLIGRHRIFVVFTINEKGKVDNIKTRGPHRKLEEEAERVIKLLPKMSPGRQRDRPVAVSYSLPILFEIRSI